MRKAAYRVFVLLVLLVSPILYPLLLLFLMVADGEWPRGGLVVMYRLAWKQLMRGYP